MAPAKAPLDAMIARDGYNGLTLRDLERLAMKLRLSAKDRREEFVTQL